jgi:hypothetical protein
VTGLELSDWRIDERERRIKVANPEKELPNKVSAHLKTCFGPTKRRGAERKPD